MNKQMKKNDVWIYRHSDGLYYIYGYAPDGVAHPIVVASSDFQWMKGFFGLRYQMRKKSKRLMRWRVPLVPIKVKKATP